MIRKIKINATAKSINIKAWLAIKSRTQVKRPKINAIAHSPPHPIAAFCGFFWTRAKNTAMPVANTKSGNMLII